MPCFRPLDAWRTWERNPKTRKRLIAFTPRGCSPVDDYIQLPCGQCIGCRLERSRQWAIRMTHEAQLHAENSFITLTYNDENLPACGSLEFKDFQDFMKRLRKRFGAGIRFFHCGEYGERFARPHYHAALFGFDFQDKTPWRKTKQGHQIWRSKALEELWPLGNSEIGSLTFESAAYIARYITKKITGPQAVDHYTSIDDEGFVMTRKPEYTTMSRRPGIAKGWYEKHSSDVYPHDEVVLREKVMKPPRYYDTQFELEYPSDFEKLKRQRRKDAEERKKKAKNEPFDRLQTLEEIQHRKAQLLIRGYENET